MRAFIAAFMILVAATSAIASVVEVGSLAPAFTATDLDGKVVHLSDFTGKIVVLEWINEGCPFSKGHYLSGNMQALQQEYTGKGVVWLTINSTRTDHPEYFAPSVAKKQLVKWGTHATRNLIDTDGTVGHLYGAKTTPHMFVIDKQGVLRYSGAIDDHRATDGGQTAHVNYVREALNALLAGKPVTTTTTTSYGCSVKY